jgi:hypothetical protein
VRPTSLPPPQGTGAGVADRGAEPVRVQQRGHLHCLRGPSRGPRADVSSCAGDVVLQRHRLLDIDGPGWRDGHHLRPGKPLPAPSAMRPALAANVSPWTRDNAPFDAARSSAAMCPEGHARHFHAPILASAAPLAGPESLGLDALPALGLQPVPRCSMAAPVRPKCHLHQVCVSGMWATATMRCYHTLTPWFVRAFSARLRSGVWRQELPRAGRRAAAGHPHPVAGVHPHRPPLAAGSCAPSPPAVPRSTAPISRQGSPTCHQRHCH